MQNALLYDRNDWETVADKLRLGAVGIIPTDTLYGIVASMHQAEAVERVYTLKNRDITKPCIILISDLSDLQLFGIDISLYEDNLSSYWPGKVSLVLPVGICHEHICRGGSSVAFRLPNDMWLRALLKKSGPLVVPSANPESKAPATTIAEAQTYFGDSVDFYVEGGALVGEPSALISLETGIPQKLR